MIYFLRHGLDDEKFVGGWSDVSLIEEGINQVISSLNKLKKQDIVINKIITSPIKRAEESAKLACDVLALQEYIICEYLLEQNKGLLNGMLKSEAKIKYPEYMKDVRVDTVYPEGESLLDLYKRIKDNLDDILNIPDNTLVVTHRGVINMLYYILNDLPLDMDKEKFSVTHASIHELNPKKLEIRKVI